MQMTYSTGCICSFKQKINFVFCYFLLSQNKRNAKYISCFKRTDATSVVCHLYKTIALKVLNTLIARACS